MGKILRWGLFCTIHLVYWLLALIVIALLLVLSAITFILTIMQKPLLYSVQDSGCAKVHRWLLPAYEKMEALVCQNLVVSARN